MRLTHWLKQLFPLTYRQLYASPTGEQHFAVWKMWLGRIYNINDFVILHNFDLERRCQQAIAAGNYREAARLLLVLEEAQHQRHMRIRELCQGQPAEQRCMDRCNKSCCDTQCNSTYAAEDGAYIVSPQAYIRLVNGAQSIILPGQFFVPTGDQITFQPAEDDGLFAAMAEQVVYKKLSEITDEEAASAGYYDADVCRAALRGEGCDGAVTIINLERSDI